MTSKIHQGITFGHITSNHFEIMAFANFSMHIFVKEKNHFFTFSGGHREEPVALLAEGSGLAISSTGHPPFSLLCHSLQYGVGYREVQPMADCLLSHLYRGGCRHRPIEGESGNTFSTSDINHLPCA